MKQEIASTIPDSLFLKVKGEVTAGKMWEKVKDEFKKKSKMMTVDLCRKLQEEHCPENGDVKTHLKSSNPYVRISPQWEPIQEMKTSLQYS